MCIATKVHECWKRKFSTIYVQQCPFSIDILVDFGVLKVKKYAYCFY